MNKAINLLKILFYISILILIFFSLYPGSIFGLVIYGDSKETPHVINYTFETTFIHFVYYFYVSILGFFIYFKKKNFLKILILLFGLSIFLELFQIMIPNRTFQFFDLISNFLGVSFAFIIFKFFVKI